MGFGPYNGAVSIQTESYTVLDFLIGFTLSCQTNIRRMPIYKPEPCGIVFDAHVLHATSRHLTTFLSLDTIERSIAILLVW